MSTKTTFKRVALVAVAALGLGVLTSVAPASAANASTALSAGTPAPARVGVVSGATLITATSDTSTASGEVVTAQIVSAPATSVAAILSFADVTNTTTGYVATTNYSNQKTDQTLAGQSGGGIAYATYTGLPGTSEKFYVKLKADVAGTYQILVTADGSTTTGYSVGKKSTVYSITTAGAPTALTLTKVGAAVGNETSAGAIVKLTMKDANGVATVLGLNEGLSITHSLTNATTGTTLNVSSWAPGDDSAGTYKATVIGLAGTTDGSDVVTVAGTGVLSSSLTSNITVSAYATTAAAGTLTLTSATGYAGTTPTFTTAAKSSHGFTLTQSAAVTADTVYPVKVAVTGGDTIATTVSIAKDAKTGTVSVSQALSTTYTSVVVTSSNAITINYAAAAMDAVSVASNNTSILSALAAKNTYTAKVVDQYANAMANVAVTASVAGRNTVASSTIGVTDANGLISFSFTDAGTTGTKDTVTFGIASGTTSSATATITYGTVTVDSVTVSGGSKAETVAGSTLTAINATDNGPETSAVSIKAVVKDASGNLLAGVPVVFTVDKGLVVKTTSIDYATVYTGADGSASTKVFNWVPGTQTITATAGGKSSTDYLTWGSAAASAARVLSVSATGDIVTVKVVDRFGNAVKGVSVDLSRTGTGLFGNGSSTQTVVTDKNGTSDVRFSGTGTVVAELAATYDQAADVAGQISATAVTAAVAGTTKGTGASLAPAGVSKASIAIEEASNSTLAAAQSASDAAAEATDAANAATDAANAAAEAADAATAAAQDAADAVAALSTQVGEMIDALKKQITALTNLVIKIQKKVKA
jgi:hypothetical protein